MDEAQPARSADRIYERVKAMACTYRLSPGGRVNEVELARQLGVSRTPLREALNRLSSEGFLVPTLNKGYHVRPLNPAEILALYEFRATLEVGSLYLACERATDDALGGLEAFARQSRDEPDEDARALRLLHLDEQFHERLAILSGNDEFTRAIRATNERIRFVRWIDMQDRRAGTQDEHLTILRHLRSRDATAAGALMRQHISRRLDQITDVIRISYGEIYTGNALAAHVLGDAA
ncbi:GntR family transcriptional regulator [Roseomonas haemaphysalidis]|uniref:GntR family transcriptional regulator n=1 Tax=Roseomonas haemaphysalidis TaxID=2768162 RepID=A0ABS3KWG6_9PROT|nr:GntR family transcriptional regulator [Roseomonas haemaphysalidis]MBO1081242.1 GntR family transcriptional regulator [Roseomonas haemaphysalidis]